MKNEFIFRRFPSANPYDACESPRELYIYLLYVLVSLSICFLSLYAHRPCEKEKSIGDLGVSARPTDPYFSELLQVSITLSAGNGLLHVLYICRRFCCFRRRCGDKSADEAFGSSLALNRTQVSRTLRPFNERSADGHATARALIFKPTPIVSCQHVLID